MFSFSRHCYPKQLPRGNFNFQPFDLQSITLTTYNIPDEIKEYQPHTLSTVARPGSS